MRIGPKRILAFLAIALLAIVLAGGLTGCDRPTKPGGGILRSTPISQVGFDRMSSSHSNATVVGFKLTDGNWVHHAYTANINGSDSACKVGNTLAVSWREANGAFSLHKDCSNCVEQSLGTQRVTSPTSVTRAPLDGAQVVTFAAMSDSGSLMSGLQLSFDYELDAVEWERVLGAAASAPGAVITFSPEGSASFDLALPPRCPVDWAPALQACD